MSVNGDIRAMLSTAIRGVSGLPTADGRIRVCAFVPEQITPPCVILSPGAWTGPGASGFVEHEREWVAQIVAGRAADEAAQRLLDVLVETTGDGSLIVAINAALAGTGNVVGADEYMALPVGDLAYVACNLRIHLFTDH